METSYSNSDSSTKTCECVKTPNRGRRVARAGCPDDDDAVAALPDDWTPRHSGPILANYLKQRERDHQNVHEDIVKCAAVLNEDIDNKVRILAENLLAHINQNQNDMDCVVKKCDTREGILTKEARDDALKQINELYKQRFDVKATFKREASALERERAERLKTILRDNFQRLVAVGHMTPKELLHDFDERIYEINQQLLSNSRALTELEAQLRVQVDETVLRARSSLNQLTLGIGVVYRGRINSHSALRVNEEKIAMRRSTSEDRFREMSLGRSFLGDVQELDACVARLVQAYRTAVLKVYTGFYSKLDDLEKDICGHICLLDCNLLHVCDFSDFHSLIERPLHRLSSFNKKKAPSKTLLEITGADVISMQKSLWSLGECLQDTYAILHHAGHLWDAHILRSALVQKLTIAAVEDLITSHDAIELANEIPISIAMEQLRCSPDEEKLQQQYEAVMTLLAQTAEMYLQHSESELGRLDEFMNLPAAMASTLLSEFDLFLEKYPRSSQSQGIAISPHTSSPKRNPSTLRLPLPRAILQTELQELALKNWRNGFLESFEGNVSLVPEELRHQAHLWVEERSTSLHMRYSFKMLSHGIRMERVKAIRDERLAELRHHDARLDSHLNAVYNLVERLPVEAAEFAAVDAPYLYPLVKWIEVIKSNIDNLTDEADPEVKKLKMSSYAPRLPKHRSLFEESLDNAVAEYKLHLEQYVQEARISTVRFISQIRLFNEGGRYAAQEATRTCTVLIKASEALELCSHKALDALNHRRSQLLISADILMLPLFRLLEDSGKLGAKSSTRQQDKKKKK